MHDPHHNSFFLKRDFLLKQALNSFTKVIFPVRQISYSIAHEPHLSPDWIDCERCFELCNWLEKVKPPVVIKNQKPI